LRLSVSNTLGWLVDVPEVVDEPVVPAVVARDRPRMKYQTRAAMIARPRMIQSQEAPLPSSAVAGAAGEPGAAGGVAWARASLTPASVTIVKAWSLFSIMCSPSAQKGCGSTLAAGPAFRSPPSGRHNEVELLKLRAIGHR
jgi:hypothetical protein